MTTNRRTLIYLGLLYLTFVVYGSLVPLRFKPVGLAGAGSSFVNLPYLTLGIDSRADWVANILLFIPLSFLWSGILLPERGRLRRFMVSVAIFTIMIGLSAGIEFTQIFFPPRTVSLNDIIAEGLGAAAGIIGWWLVGQRFLAWLEGLKVAHRHSGRIENIFWIYVAVLVGYNLLPLDFTISPVELYHKWKEGRVVFTPFAFDIMDVKGGYGVLTDVILWVPVALLLVLSGKKSVWQAWTWTVLAATAIEGVQLFVWTRVTDVNDILAAMIGGVCGAWMGRWFRGMGADVKVPSKEGEESGFGWGWFALFCMWGAVLAAVFWYPYTFTAGRVLLMSRIKILMYVPFHAYYFVTEYRAVTELLHRIAFFFPLGCFLAVAFNRTRLSPAIRMGAALVLSGSGALAIEAGRLFIPAKNPDSIDIVLEIIGAVLGYWTVRFAMGWRDVPHNRVNNGEWHPAPSNSNVPGHTDYASLASHAGWYFWVIGGPAMLYLAGLLIMQSSAVPYNVLKLFGDGYPLITLLALLAVLYWSFGLPVLLKRWLSRGSPLRVAAFLLVVIVHGAVGYNLLRVSVPVEMIYKIVGSPILGWTWEWEPLGRFIALSAAPTVILTGALLFIPLQWDAVSLQQSAPRWLAVAVVMLPITHWVVVTNACTDNLTELMTGGGTWFSSVMLSGWLFTIAYAGTVLSAKVSGFLRGWSTLVFLLIFLSIPIGYGLLWAGTERDIYKYGSHFSAMQFILSPDRAHYAGGGALIFRYTVAHLLSIGTIGITQFPFMRMLQRSYEHHRLHFAGKVRPVENP